jgi:hypothetical protein
MSPLPVQALIPLIVVANGPNALAVTASHADGWVTFPALRTSRPHAHHATQNFAQLLGDKPVAVAGRLRRSGRPETCFDEIVCNAPKPDERAVFDTVADRLPSYTEPVLRAPRTAPG